MEHLLFQFKYYMFGITTSVEFIAQSEKDFTVETLQEIQRNVYKNKTQYVLHELLILYLKFCRIIVNKCYYSHNTFFYKKNQTNFILNRSCR
jgi:hypothetical protein